MALLRPGWYPLRAPARPANSVIGRLNNRFRTVGLDAQRLYRGGFVLAPLAPPDEVE